MYYALDEAGVVFEDATLAGTIKQLEEEGEFWGESLNTSIAGGSVQIFKGTRVKVKYTPPQYTEVVETKQVKKPVVAKKLQVKAKR